MILMLLLRFVPAFALRCIVFQYLSVSFRRHRLMAARCYFVAIAIFFRFVYYNIYTNLNKRNVLFYLFLSCWVLVFFLFIMSKLILARFCWFIRI